MFTIYAICGPLSRRLNPIGLAVSCILATLNLFQILPANAENCRSDVCMLMPKAGEAVPERPILDVSVKDPNADVWVIVHPMEVADYWVQPKLTNRGEGNFRGSIYIGRPGSIDIGKRFEIMAVANPKKKLARGDVLPDFPDAAHRSQIIEVIRK